MKLILKENIETLGHIGDIVKVAPGYARNYLLPKGLAVEATEKNAKALEHLKRQMAYKKNKALESAQALATRLGALPIELLHKAGEEGKLFGSVTNMEIAAYLHDKGLVASLQVHKSPMKPLVPTQSMEDVHNQLLKPQRRVRQN